MLDKLIHNDVVVAYIARASICPDKTTFVTPPELQQQLGYIVYPANSEIPKHKHVPLVRQLVGTTEVIIVKKGKCLVDFYNDNDVLIDTQILNIGDILLLVSGGHGFRMLEDTVLLEIKQGPYTGLQEKILF